MATNTNPFYTYSATAGSSKTLQKPQDGGDNNQWGNYINTDLDEIVAAVNALSDKIADANENELIDFTATGSAVNHIGITNAATGTPPQISSAGSDTNVDLTLTAQGTGDINLTPGTNGDVNIPASKGITFGDDGEKIEGDGTDLTIASSATLNVNTGSSSGNDLKVNTSQLVVEGDTGNVGIGMTPERLLDLQATSHLALRFFNSSTFKAGIQVATGAGEMITSSAADDLCVRSEENILFSAGGATERMRIDSSGNLGIGETGPSSRLHIKNTSANDGIRIISSTTGEGYVIFGDTDDSSTGVIAYNHTADAMTFDVNNAERMQIDSSGNLKFNSGFGSVETAYGCRAWVNFNGTGTLAIRDSGNVSSVTDNGTGNYTVNFTTAMPDANYADIITLSNVSGNQQAIRKTAYSPSTTSRRFECFDGNGFEDNETVTFAVFR